MLVKQIVKDPSKLEVTSQYTIAKMYKHVYNSDNTFQITFLQKTLAYSIYFPKVVNSVIISLSRHQIITINFKTSHIRINTYQIKGTKKEKEKFFNFISMTSAVKHPKKIVSIPS